MTWDRVFALLALIVSSVAVIVSYYNSKYLQRRTHVFQIKMAKTLAIGQVHREIVKNVARFNGILNSVTMGITTLNDDQIAELVRLFSESRDAYESIRHNISKNSTDKLDNEIEGIERYVKETIHKKGVGKAIVMQGNFLNNLTDTCDDELQTLRSKL